MRKMADERLLRNGEDVVNLAAVGGIARRAAQDATLAARIALHGLDDRDNGDGAGWRRKPIATAPAQPRPYQAGAHELAHDLAHQAFGDVRPARDVCARQDARFLGEENHGANGVIAAPGQLQSHGHSSPHAKGTEIGPNGPCQRPFETTTLLVSICCAGVVPQPGDRIT